MKPADVIIYKASNRDALDKALNEALDYALLSFPFTVNRMNLRNPKSRISNIFKGKIAESLLKLFSEENGLELDFDAGQTPFWMRDAFDFQWKGQKWDLKNNFLYHSGETLSSEAYMKLPALVPNRFAGDQWALADEAGKAFLFSFLRQSDTRDGVPFFEIHYSDGALRFLSNLSTAHAGTFPERAPYLESWFWATLEKEGGKPTLTMSSTPSLVITGACRQGERRLFMDTDGRSNHGYAHYLGGWYKVREDGGLSFSDGILHTKITNATCPVGFLPAFRSLLQDKGF
jgi:hypothetical protein